MIVHAKPSSPGTEGKLMNVDAREVDFMCGGEKGMEEGEEEMRVLLYFLLEGSAKQKA